jgi:integrase
MRRGEILKLRWQDVDFMASLIIVRAFNTKTMRERQVSMTARLTAELEALWGASPKEPTSLVFGFSEIRGSFKRACKEAGLNGVRFHDLRHTHATRLDDLGFSLARIGGQLGHLIMQTTLRYVNRDNSSVRQVASALDDFNSKTKDEVKGEIATEMIN